MSKIILEGISIEDFTNMICEKIRAELSGNPKEETAPLGVYSDEQVTKLFGVSRSTTYQWRKQNLIPYKRVGRLIFYDAKDVKKLIQDRK